MRALVIGAALSGISASKLLVKKGYEVYLTDMKTIAAKKDLEALGIKVYDGGHPDSLKDLDYDLIVKNPGIKPTVPFVKYFCDKGYPLLSEIEIALRYGNFSYGAITGTNGKTTTTTLLGEFLKKIDKDAKACGNNGYPLCDIAAEYEGKDLHLAIEIAAFQLLGCPHFHPTVSVCMNLTPDHLDYFKDVDDYYRAKMLIYKNQSDDDWFLLNLDDENICALVTDVKCRIVTFSVKKDADLTVRGDGVYLFDNELFKLSDLKLPGVHNLYNAMVAAAMAYKLGVSIADIRDVLRNFKGVRHRLEFVKEVAGVKYYNDSKGTNVDATKVALSAFDKVILLAGGYDKKTGFQDIIPYLDHVKEMYVFGATKDELKKIYPEAVVCTGLKEALTKAHSSAKAGDIVLLSPMCASWDQYANFEERGDEFVKLVESL